MNNKISFQILNKTNMEEYKRIRLEGLKNSPLNFGSSFEEESLFNDEKWISRLSNNNALTFGALIESKLVGVVTLTLNTRLKTKHTAEIHAMYVSKMHQRKGIGFKLINSLIEYSKDLKTIEQITLSVEKENESAIKLYRRSGFIKFAEVPSSLKVENQYYDFIMMNVFL